MVGTVTSLLLCALGADVFQLPPPRQMYCGGGVRMDYSLSYRKTPAEMSTGGRACTNKCLGKKHILHDGCDLSCDERCKVGVHQFTAEPFVHCYNIPVLQVSRDFAKTGGTAPVAQHLESVVKGINAALAAQKNLKTEHRLQCWNEKPCVESWKSPKYDIHILVLTYQFFVERRDANGNLLGTTPIGQPTTCDVGDLSVPNGGMYLDDREYCACHVVRYVDDEESFVDPGPTETPPPPPPPPPQTTPRPVTGETGCRWESNQGSLCGESALGRLSCDFEFTGMNEGACTAENPTDKPISLCFPAGTCYDTDEDGIQDVVQIRDAKLTIPPNSDALAIAIYEVAGIAGPSFLPGNGKATVELKTMCLEMAKREPRKGIKFVPTRAPSSDVARIAQQISKSMVVGPWDQAKVWIYTDSATYTEIEKKLIPPPPPAMYVRSLHDLSRIGISLREDRYRGCFEPRLLAAVASPEASGWFAEAILAMKPDEVARWLQGEGRGRMLKLLEGDKDSVAHFALVVRALCMQPGVESQRAGLSLLGSVPEASRAALAQPPLLPAWSLCWSSDSAVREEAVKLVETFNPPAKEFVLANVPK